MELIYLYIDGYRNFQQAEFNFCPDLSVQYKSDGHSVIIDNSIFHICRDCPLRCGRHIYWCFANREFCA